MNQVLKCVLLAFVSVTVASVPATAKQSRPYETSLSGNYLASRSAGRLRDNDAAADYLAAALLQDPGNPVLTERLFQLELSSGNLAQAEILAERVLAFNSQQRMARIVLGLSEFRKQRFTEARVHFMEAAYTPVGQLTSALLNAWTYAGEGSLNAALKELDKLDANGSFANFKSFHAGLISDYLNSALRAEAAYNKAYQDAGTSLRVTQAYGNFLERNNRFEEAEKIYRAFLSGGERNVLVDGALKRAATRTKPGALIQSPEAGAGEALFSLAAAMNDDQSIDVALLYAQLAVLFSADRPVALTLLADIFAGTNRYQAAIDTFEQIPQSSELRVNADTEIAVNLQKLDRTNDAQARVKSILSRDPKNLDAWITLGNILRNNESFGPAAEAYSSAIALVPSPERNQWNMFYYRGICNERLKQWPQAEADFRKALALSPDEPSVLNYLGYSLIDMKIKLDEAIAMVKKAVELRPNDGYIVDSLGWAYFQLGEFDEAVIHLERAVELKPGDPIIAEHMGDAYWRANRRLEAKFQWQHAKDNKPEPADLLRIEDKLKNGLPALPPPATPADNGATPPSNG